MELVRERSSVMRSLWRRRTQLRDAMAMGNDVMSKRPDDVQALGKNGVCINQVARDEFQKKRIWDIISESSEARPPKPKLQKRQR